ncbi:serine/threonine/tyrosine-interacting-like protein 2 [Anguilla rostrata]|uniref:serine/threonine/tyrosine-interacting-like protein 2 n=1 Tax=Anguilla rostrata TaxID=7938 RepID=UPI0030CFBE30
MATHSDQENEADHVVPDDDIISVNSTSSNHLRCSSPSRFSVISGADTESIFMDPLNLSSLLPTKRNDDMDLQEEDSEVDPAEQMMVEDLYNCVRDMVDESSPYNTPCVLDIQRALVQDRLEAPLNAVDEVWPNIFIAEKMVAVNKSRLKRMGITHVLNAAHGTGVYTGTDFYAGMNIQYHGIEVDDFPSADISPFLRSAAEFLDEALLTHKGKVLVDSVMGVSRSAVLVAAYLMIFHHMTILEALLALRRKRPVCPNEGFLKQLRDLNEALLEERDEDERSDTLSQSSVVDALARRQPESIMGAQVHSILAEEQDGASVASTCTTSRDGRVPSLPAERREEEEAEEDVGRLVKEWQQRNERYQDEGWWQAQLLSDDEDEESVAGGRRRRPLPEDLESVTSADVRAVTEGIRRARAESVSSVATDTSSYADMWKQRLKEIEEQAAARYKGRGQDDDSESGGGVGDEEVESVLSEPGSLYNFCKKNKDTLTPLERWRVKRIQFGWNKKDAEAEQGAGGEGGAGEGEAQEAKPPALEDVNLTAYQSWKMRQQKKLGEVDKDAIVEMSRAQDSALARRRQRREEVLERSRRTLEESQSSCGWETESTLSGSTIPLSAFWQLASARSPAPDDSASVLSGRSSASRARSARSSATAPPQAPPTPMVPLPNLQGQGNEAVDLLSIQNWIANVVTETLMQKQGEMLMGGGSLPPSRAGSVLSLGAHSGRPVDDDKASMLSGASYTSGLSRGGGESMLSGGGTSSYSGYGSGRTKITKTSVPLYSLFQDQVDLRKLDSMDKEMKSEMRGKMDSYELQKIASDNKRSTLFKKKKKKEESDEEAEDDSEGTAKVTSKYSPDPTHVSARDPTRISARDLTRDPTRISARDLTRVPARDPTRDPALHRWDGPSAGTAGRFGNSAAERDKTSSIDKWLDDIRAPSRYPRPDRAAPGEPAAEPDCAYSSRRRASESSFQSEEEECASSTAAEEDFSSCSFHGSNDADPTTEMPYHPRRFPPATDPLSNGLKASQSYRVQRAYTSEEEEEEEERAYGARQTFSRYRDDRAEPRRGGREEEGEEEEEVSSFISRCRQRSRVQAEEELDEDDVIGAWRRQQEAKRRAYKDSDS